MGVPIVCARINSDGNPDRRDRRWDGWDEAKPGRASAQRLRAYRPGDAVAAIGGTVLDWIDYDPRSDPDGKGWEWLTSSANGAEPVTRTRTPSGGWHMGIPSLNLPKGKVAPGVDYQGGLREPDDHGKTRRGFVFIPPTKRPSKAEDDHGEVRPYESEIVGELTDASGYAGLRKAIEESRAKRARSSGNGKSSGRRKPSELRDACLKAESGEQRLALLRIVKEWQYRGYELEDIFNLFVQLVSEMPAYEADNPWYNPEMPDSDQHFRSLLMEAGTFTPDARPGELEAFRLHYSSNDEFVSADDINEEEVRWLNEPFLPAGCLVIIDGDPGQGKSIITTGMVARAATGKPVLPFGNSGLGADEAIPCGMIGAEDDIGQAIMGRLRAAGWNRGNGNVWFMRLGRDKSGNIEMLTFPHGTERVHEFITANGLRLLIVDPVSAFLGENIHTHNEASVRAALAPLAEIAKETGCCIVLVRHLNKDGSMKALYRGTGSIAFSAIARSGLITGVCPDDHSLALAQVKCSYAERYEGVIRYSVRRWSEDESKPVVEWGEWDRTLTADDIAKGPKVQKGPEPGSQKAIEAVLRPMFAERDTWPQADCIKRLEEAGASTHPTTLGKVKDTMAIRSVPNRHPDTGLVRGWAWTIRKISVSRGRD